MRKVLDEKGKEIILNAQENAKVEYLNGVLENDPRLFQFQNALGSEIDITTLTQIVKLVTTQKFFELRPSEYMPVRVGQGSFMTNLVTWREFNPAGDFEDGNINHASDHGAISETKAAVDQITVPIINWAKMVSWSLFDLQHASRSGNWSLIESLQRSRKKNWDLGIQRIAFLGSASNTDVKGLLTQSNVTANTSLITQDIAAMNQTDFEEFVRGLVDAYRANALRTAYPTHFIIPEGDFNGLGVATSEQFPLKSKLERLREMFATITMNPNFKILPLAYADQENNADVSGLNRNRYVLLNYDEASGRIDIPVDYTSTMQDTINGFQYQNVAYGQYTGFQVYREREFLYFDFTN